ncbi:MAG: SRPBCC domain-containing protein, partial [Marinoscillum sp.]
YTYLSSFSNLEDVSDNYSVITFRLADKNGQTDLSLRQLGFVNEESMNHSMQNWKMVLDSMKQLAESA